MASPKTIALKERLAGNHAATLGRITKERGLGPVPRTSSRWMARRTKGLPYSRMQLIGTIPAQNGRPSILLLSHPTRKTSAAKQATPQLLATFFPSLPPGLAQHMLGY
ncbi:hypothetical protein ACFQXB_11640 [Plastorhodobacter daqingensis]|uniref:IS481 family transposase n=1 Tax=Plastorhodobacter daqingensis TaxID=1387281 RepID=A0ABW2UKV9_9RHOB